MESQIELTSQQIEITPQHESWYSTITISILLMLYLYVAIKEYPKWRNLRENFFTKSKQNLNTDNTDSKSEPLKKKNLLIYIPFIPFAAIYLTLRIIWDVFKLFVFYSLDLIEAGFLMFWRILIQNIKMIPKICAAMLSSWETYIQKPFLKTLYLWLDWMYLYGQPVLKSMAIFTWDVSVNIWTEGQKFAIGSWNILVVSAKIGWNGIILPSLKFTLWAIITFIFEPGKWLVSRTAYLGGVTWYCACFLARDLAEDFKELLCVGWKISVLSFDNIFQPSGKLIVKVCRKTANCFLILENFLEKLIIRIHGRAKCDFIILGEFLYTRFILALTNETIYMTYEIFRDPLFRSCVELICFIFIILPKRIARNIFSKLQIIKPKLMKRMRQCGSELEEFIFTSAFGIARLIYTFYTISLPIIMSIPIIWYEFKQICNGFYRGVKKCVSTILKLLWTVFVPLLRPVILALSFFYTTVILSIILSAFRMASWIISMSIVALILLQRGLSTLCSMLLSIYNNIFLRCVSLILQTAKELVYGIYVTINDFVEEYFPLFMDYFVGTVLRQLQLFREYVVDTYTKHEAVIIEFKDRVKAAADEVIYGIGQGMLEWVKKERALKEGISSSSTQ